MISIRYRSSRPRVRQAARVPRISSPRPPVSVLTAIRGRCIFMRTAVRRRVGANPHVRSRVEEGRGLEAWPIAPFPFPAHQTGRAALSGSSAIAGFRPHRSHRAALPQWALQKGPEAGRSSGRLVHTREVRLQGLPALCPALRLPRRDPFLPLPFLHRLVSFGDFIDSMERSDFRIRDAANYGSSSFAATGRPPVDADGSL